MMQSKDMVVTESTRFEERVLETVKLCQERKASPSRWGMEVSKCVSEAGLGLPSPELGQVLVSNLCFNFNNPSLWKFIEQAISSGLLSSLQVLALLTPRVIPNRRTQPEAYRLYLELLSRYVFSPTSMGTNSCRNKIIKCVDDALQLSQTYGVLKMELGHALVLFLFSIIIGLIDSTLDDWGLQSTFVDKLSGIVGGGGHQDMDVNYKDNQNDKRNELREQLSRANAFTAMEVLGKLTENRKAMVLLRLVHLNMPEKFNRLLQRLQFLEANKLVSSNLKSVSQFLVRLSANIQRALGLEKQLNKRQLIGVLIDIGSFSSASCCNFGTGRAACWVTFDMYMETAMDGKQFPATSAIDVLTELIKTLQVINHSSWQQTFQALWISALRLVQRERDPVEGPIPHLDARLSFLLSIIPLAIVRVVDDEGGLPLSSFPESSGSGNVGTSHASKKHGLVSSLQSLGQFAGLLSPPKSVVIAANNAALKAANFISNFKSGSDTYVKAGGNMLHLIVEACISRKLIDTTAYSWPGYVSASITSMSDSSLGQGSPWSTFMEGAQLSGPLKDALIATPASSLVEIEKLYHIALNGSEEERSAAAKILCGASLSRGWNIQEHVVRLVVKLLAPPVPPNFTGLGSHLVDYMSMLNAVLFGLSSADTVHVISLHGMVPEVAASLMPLCEAFGSLIPTPSHKPCAGDESSVYTVFSCAFLFLLRLWKFYRPPHEHCITEGGGYNGYELTLEYLLILHNSRIASHKSTSTNKINKVENPLETSSSGQPIYIESFPKLRAWYCQNKACIASTLSSLGSGNPVHQVANKILNMIYWKMTKGGIMTGKPSTPSGSSISGSPVTTVEDVYERPMLPAWEVLEATPFVLEAVLTACAHGRLSSRDLTTGLRDLVDFLPASLATIVTYFSAEVTRGIWKPVSMNGIDWPSPAATLFSIESEIKEILAPLGVTIPKSPTGVASVMLPLPVAAMVSLTITFKLEKSLEYIHVVSGPALESCASSCPWPGMPIIGALWAQKVRRLHDYIVVTCSRSVFRHNKEAIAQLLRSCFTSFLGSPHVVVCPATAQMGVNGLLGSNVSALGPRPSIAPGFLYLGTCRSLQNFNFVNNVIVELVVESAQESAAGWAHTNSARLKSSRSSLASATARAKEVAMLGASLLCVTGGVQLVQVLYQETISMWLLSTRDRKHGGVGPISCILEGYTMAYLMFLSGSFVWGVGETCSTRPLSRRPRILRVHMDFIAGALEGNISLGCEPATWKAYVSCFVGLIVSFAPVWVREIKHETLRKLADGLRGWHECELALSLLERGGAETMGVIEMDGKRISVSPRPCCGRRILVKKRPRVDGFVNSVKKLQRREICSKRDRAFSMSNAQERFRNIGLREEYDTHDPKGHCPLVLPFLKKRSKIIEIVAARDIVFALAQSGVCAAFSREANQRICFLNVSPDEVIRSLFYNKNNDSLITVSVYASDNFSSLKCRTTRIEYIRRGKPDAGFALFESESLKWPGFVEFDDVNGKVLTYSAQDSIYKVFDLKNYTLLYSISDKNVQEIKISPGIMLLIFTRAGSHVPLKILSIEDGTVLKAFNHLLHRNKKVDFIEQFNEKLLVKQENENLQILDVRNSELTEVNRTEFMTPSAFIFLYENQLFLTFRNRTVAVWNFRGELVTSFEDHLLWHPDCNTNNIYITSDQDLIISYCKADSDDPLEGNAGSINISNILTGKCLAKIRASNSNPKDECSSGRGKLKKRSYASRLRNSVAEALEDITALFYDEERNEIYTGNRQGLVHVWSN